MTFAPARKLSDKTARKFWQIILHQTHYEKSDWSSAFNQFTIACELDMINSAFVGKELFYHVISGSNVTCDVH